ncbi:hypothetical protein ACFTSF_04525 [Kribbella sp. NPDC056951]|uniref:hypothetical protein n=1 Tax=Kribbella sp. NPDC056951 TaxID=3345978 RepID=UPI0036281B0F
MKHTDHEPPADRNARAIAALAGELDRARREHTNTLLAVGAKANQEDLTRLAQVVHELSELVMTSRAKKTGGDAPAVRSWLMLAEDETAVQAVLAELLPWMRDVFLRYRDGREALCVCWLWHPEIVEELVVLMDAWTVAFSGDEASVKAASDWHDRQRPGVARRVAVYGESCDVLKHRDDAGKDAPDVPLVNDCDPFVGWWATDRAHTGPVPTPAHVDAGRRHLSPVPGAGQAAGGTR